MKTDSNLHFIKNKIYEVRSALMHNYSNDIVRLPNGIVNVIMVDSEGQVWFTFDKSPYHSDQYSRVFPVTLQFYRKGKLFHLEISGPAEIEDELNNETEEVGNKLLLKMKMKSISYSETHKKTTIEARQRIKKVYQFLSAHLTIPPAFQTIAGSLKKAGIF